MFCPAYCGMFGETYFWVVHCNHFTIPSSENNPVIVIATAVATLFRRGERDTDLKHVTKRRPRLIWRKICGREGSWKLDLMVNRSTSVGLCCLTITLLTLAKVQHDTFLNEIFDKGGGEKNWGGLQSQWGSVSENSWEWSEVGWELSSLGRPLPSLPPSSESDEITLEVAPVNTARGRSLHPPQ